MVRLRRGLVLICACGLASACNFAPHYTRPTTEPAPPAYQEAAGWKTAEPADAGNRGEWWAIFNDERLNSLENQVTVSNQNIKAAFARLQQARAQTRIERSYLFPTLTAGARGVRDRQSVNSPAYTPTKPATGNDFTLNADISYEFDAWGRIRNLLAAARASEQASAADLATLDLSTHAELAADYFTLCSEDTQQQLLDRTAADYSDALALTQNLFNGGAAALSDLDQAKAQLQTALTQAADNRLQRAQTEHAIAVLLGVSPLDLASRGGASESASGAAGHRPGVTVGAVGAAPGYCGRRAAGGRCECADRRGTGGVFSRVQSVCTGGLREHSDIESADSA